MAAARHLERAPIKPFGVLVDGHLQRAEQNTLRRVSPGLGLSEEEFREVYEEILRLHGR
jgi:hypothetical protein